MTGLKQKDFSFFTFGGANNYSYSGNVVTVFVTPYAPVLVRPGINFLSLNKRAVGISGDISIIDRDKNSANLTVLSR